MPTIMSDNDVIGQVNRLTVLGQSEGWADVWDELGIRVATFADVCLSADATDQEIWNVCQRQSIILVTGNRSSDESTSLEATLRTQADEHSLPVVTISDTGRILQDRNYAEHTLKRLLEILMDLENLRGSQRLFIP